MLVPSPPHRFAEIWGTLELRGKGGFLGNAGSIGMWIEHARTVPAVPFLRARTGCLTLCVLAAL